MHTWLKCCLALALALSASTPSWALIRNGNRWPINLGITGLRADLKPNAPKTLVVVEVLPNTPAEGKVMKGDQIVGVNGRPFEIAHKFGYGMKKFGYEGPMMDFGNALEESQGPKLNGRLTLDVIRGNEKSVITLKLPTKYGQYSKTYPFDCKKTDIILGELYTYLLRKQREDGSWHGRPHYNFFASMALLASKQKKYFPAVKQAMKYMGERTNDRIYYRGYDCWKNGLYGIALGEYYLATKEKWVLRELDEINRWLVKAQFAENYRRGRGMGGWGHRPANRPGGNGYGPICLITGQAMASWSLIGQCGLKVDRERYRMAHEFIAKGTNNIGYVWYADGNGGNNKYADMGRTGCSAVAHAVNPFNDKEYQQFAFRNARCIGKNFNTFFDTHGSAILGMGWTALGAAVDPPSFRNLMDNHVWFFNLAHCPDGTFYFMPNRDPNDQDYRAGKYLSASSATALIFAIKYQSLRITGAEANP
ncbi:MAG: DUF6288 domain-containing protein [Gemmataceae bacterium]